MDLIVYANYDEDDYFFTTGGVYSKSESKENISNFGRESLRIGNKYKTTENFYLSPLKIDIQKCLPLKDPMKSICLRNNIVYSAVVNNDSGICEIYDLAQPPKGSSEGWGYSSEEGWRYISKSRCYGVLEILNNNKDICSDPLLKFNLAVKSYRSLFC